MRVSLIGPLPPELGGASPGGVATHQAALAAGLASLPDIEVSLLATNLRCAAAPLPYSVVPLLRGPRLDLRLLRYTLHVAVRDRLNGSRREQLATLLSYARFLNNSQPQVVHVQHPLERLWYTNQVARLERRSWPMVVTAHSFFGEHADEVIHGFMSPNLRTADRVIAVSPHIAEQAAQLGVSPERIRVIRSGIDTERFQPRPRSPARARLGIAVDTPVVVFVGNLEPRKQLDVLLRALAGVRERLPLVCLAIVGSGEERVTLESLAEQLGIADTVRFVGRVPADALLDWYAAADVFALPSSSEAQGIVALEAMASGLPVVASDVGGLRGTVDDSVDGFLVPSGQAEPLSRRLVQLLEDLAFRSRIGVAARDKVSREFTWQRTVDATAEVYRELVS